MSPMDQYLSLKQKQELALKPKMLQSLKMLALPILELESYIKQELEANPLLELREEKDEEDIDEDSFEHSTPESSTSIDDVDTPEQPHETMAEARELTEILDQWNDYHGGSESYRSDNENDHSESLIRFEANGKDSFLEQLYPQNLADNEVDFIHEMVDSCDIYGFLPEGYDLEAVARRYNIKPTRAHELHTITLDLAPKGITSRNLSECLMAQLSPEQQQNRIICGMVCEQFDNLIHRRYQKIASFFNVSEDTILAAKEQIARLDPKPGLRILSTSAAYVYPDVTLKIIDGEYVVIINDHITPNII
ncbi:MAG TPA: RNA polymerase sigma-54 factor, partial [Candidatus Cloacimonadota bacterium]|nr:RNA polymerase sigma-54 factor [Candidatus Cloacimonadota bacterium]